MTPPLDDQLCDGCRFFISDGSSFAGECHRKPPKMKHDPAPDEQPNRGIWPTVSTSDWCGKFKQYRGDGGE